MRWLAEAAHLIGLVPLAFLAFLHWRGVRRDAGWWLMGTGFGVSFLADFLPWHIAQQTYPVTQSAIFALVLLPSYRAVERYVAFVLFAAALSVCMREGQGTDAFLRVVAWLSVSGIAYTALNRGPLRDALAFGFAAMTLAWCVYLMVPGWTSYGVYHGTRLLTAGWFCYAARRA